MAVVKSKKTKPDSTDEAITLIKGLRASLQAAGEVSKVALTRAIEAGQKVHEAKEWLKAHPTVLQTWAEWFGKNFQEFAYRTADDYERCYLQVQATFDSGVRYHSMKECLFAYRLASTKKRKKRFVPPSSAPKFAKAPTDRQVLAEKVRGHMARGESIPTTLSQTPEIVKAVKRNAQEDHDEEAKRMVQTARPLPEGYQGQSPGLLGREGMEAILLPIHLERLIRAFDDPGTIQAIQEASDPIKEVVRACLLAVIAQIPDGDDRFEICYFGLTLFPDDPDFQFQVDEDSGEGETREDETLAEAAPRFTPEEEPDFGPAGETFAVLKKDQDEPISIIIAPDLDTATVHHATRKRPQTWVDTWDEEITGFKIEDVRPKKA